MGKEVGFLLGRTAISTDDDAVGIVFQAVPYLDTISLLTKKKNGQMF